MYINVASPDDASDLSNRLKDGNWMILYYGDWCGHCKDMKPEWQKVVNKFSNSSKFNIAEIESAHIGSLSKKPTINGYPTIKMYNNGKEIANFEDERIADKIEKFANDNSVSRKISIHKEYSTHKHNNNNVNREKMNNLINKIEHIQKTIKKSHKHKTHRKHKAYKKQKARKSRKAGKTRKAGKSRKSSKSRKIQTSKNTSTKSVFNQLINSFDRIGKEARKDSTILKKAADKI